MYKRALALFALFATSLALPEPIIEERHIISVEKRQADVSQLLQLASLAGITALPTDPALLLSLGPLANSLASALPTSSVLSVLITAAPSGFISSIVNDPSYADSFQSEFSAGNSPSWFNALPTDVRSYLHTYSGFSGVAGAAGAVQGAATGASDLSSAQRTESAMSAASEENASSSGMSDSSNSAGATATSGTSMDSSTGSASSTGGGSDTSSSASDAGSSAISAAGESSESASSAADEVTSTATSAGDASRPTGVIAVGVLGAMGVLGVAAAL